MHIYMLLEVLQAKSTAFRAHVYGEHDLFTICSFLPGCPHIHCVALCAFLMGGKENEEVWVQPILNQRGLHFAQG